MPIPGHDLTREEMANTGLDNEILVIHVFRRRIESGADIVTGKAGWSFHEERPSAAVNTIRPGRNMQRFRLEQQCQVWIRMDKAPDLS